MTIKSKIKLYLIIFIILDICLVVFVIQPFIKETKNDSAEIISQKESLASLEAKKENLDNFKNRYQEIKPNLDRMNTLFVNSDVPIDFIHFLEKTFSNCGVNFNISSGIASQPADGPWSSLGFQITSVSSFPNLSKLLEKLENSQYLIKIQNISIRSLSQGEIANLQKEKKNLSSGVVEARFSLTVLAK